MTISVRVAAVQAEPTWLRLSDGVRQVVDLIGTAAAGGARLIAFPEGFLPGYPWWRWVESNQWNVEYSARCRENSITRDGREMRAVTDAARRHGIHVVLGFGERQDRKIYLAQAIVDDDGELLAVRRKAGLNSVERKVFASGTPNLPAVHHTSIGRFGALSGQENQRPLLTRALRADEEQLHIAAWPGAPEADAASPDSPSTIARLYALESGAFVVAPCAVVTEKSGGGRVERTGRARIYAPDGTEQVTPLAEGAEGLLYADIPVSASVVAPLENMRSRVPRRRTGSDRWAMPGAFDDRQDGIAAC